LSAALVDSSSIFFVQAEDGIRDATVTGVQTCALPIYARRPRGGGHARHDPRVVSRPAARARRGGGPAEGLRRGRRAVPEGHPGPAARAARAAGIAPEPVQPAPRPGLPLDG